ncbi:MAG: TrkA family potassium uptake protein [Dehalococcoidales bacterium]|nr:MAG: TrkA family potassium uptake protein [Dehalococcoidales bacterium]
MYVIVVGGGRVGYYLTRALLDEGHEVLLLEISGPIAQTLSEDLGSICVRGDGCESTTLASVGTNRADMLIAVTGDDEDNLVSCQVAKHMFGVRRTVGRIRNPKNETIFKKLGIDVIINTTNLILESIEEEVPTHTLIRLHDIRDRGLEIVEVKIPPGAPTIGKSVKELSLPEGSVLSLVIRKARRPIVPSGATILQAEDQVIAVTAHESEEALRTALSGQ